MVVICYDDGKFKIWSCHTELEDIDDNDDGDKDDINENSMLKPKVRTITSWKPKYEGFYKNISISSVAFSKDGSLLALAYGHTIVIWYFCKL